MNETGFRFGESNEDRRKEVGKHLRILDHHPLIQRGRPEMLGEGAFHSVFLLKNKKDLPRGIVAKVRRDSIIEGLKSRNLSVDRKRLELKKRQEEAGARMLKKYFGSMVLSEKIQIASVPITMDLVQALAPEIGLQDEVIQGFQDEKELPTIVILQEKAPKAAFEEGSLGVQTFFLENHPAIIDGSALEDYRLLNAVFLDNIPSDDPDLADSLTPEGSDAEDIFEKIEQNSDLAELMRDFVERAIKYSNETGAMIDFVGSNNIRVFQEEREGEKKWRICLVDARISGGHFAKGKIYVKKMLNREALTGEEIAITDMALTYTRFLNALAQKLGIEGRLSISEQSLADQSGLLLEYFVSQVDEDKDTAVAAK